MMPGQQFRDRAVAALAAVAPFLIAAVMATAAMAKIYHLQEFRELTSTFTVLPMPVRAWLPWAVPQVELLVAMLLLLTPGRGAGPLVALLVLSVFTAYLLVQSFRPFIPPCHCFGVVRLAGTAARENQIGILRNLILITLCLLAIRRRRGHPRVGNEKGHSSFPTNGLVTDPNGI